jgi:hypothetical protein
MDNYTRGKIIEYSGGNYMTEKADNRILVIDNYMRAKAGKRILVIDNYMRGNADNRILGEVIT